MTPLDHSAAVATETARLVAAVQDADPATPVPTCPGWTLTDLVRHTGSVQRWFTVLLQQRVQEPPRSRDVDLRLPEQAEDYPAWLAEAAAQAGETFAATDLDAPMWAWGADQHARFWVRRMLCETLVHRADAELALGLKVDIDPALAADAVAEFLTNLPYAVFFAPGTANLRAENRTIRFTRTDGEDSWLVQLRPDGFALTADTTPGAADATVSASAADLLLLLYGRLDRTSGGVAVSGDDDLLELWFANSAF
ncbi:maleylpyruvate isomerase family mycothiol-dependent enzyme [Kitasatospora aureofaciens]|uniref:maleylpyruvate isomerase family mycothiol-dependent enzyme n=1 Tax=Kitasatospora aureofaciens TaxID=1894 RepID=UPI001C45650D|nr:maleylpyruvate isomerase family mycothiol-dependent enzyme [Kitasatospora aureofaciens]MBV6700413.1 maleylpyruvate isomerase family mycothiol-dependent enzyme [Kitasatospora aureofaciens]